MQNNSTESNTTHSLNESDKKKTKQQIFQYFTCKIYTVD